MRILYSAIDQTVPDAHGGSVHVRSVAEGLAALGHEVHALTSTGPLGPLPSGAVTWWPLSPPLGDRRLRLLRAGRVLERARELKPDVVIERYYNFGGEGVLAARDVGALLVLEVNAPVVDYAGSIKRLLDRGLIVEPMRRWRDWQCRHADLIVTPTARIIPAHVPASKIHRTEWGADTTRFHPGASGPVPFARSADQIVAVFSGAFRSWHGAVHLVDAIRTLRSRGRTDFAAVLIGDGPELPRVREAAAGLDKIVFTAALPHEQIPAVLAAADIGVAPFDIGLHPALAHEFHWSPLKIFEYMACGLPVVTPRIARLETIVQDGREGILYDAAKPEALADALERSSRPDRRRAMGNAARERAVQEYSWDSHCHRLDEAIRAARERRRCAS
jgi:glycosyltransferase involved in cell wall biosynthesis